MQLIPSTVFDNFGKGVSILIGPRNLVPLLNLEEPTFQVNEFKVKRLQFFNDPLKQKQFIFY